jgi:acyl carrier protein
MITQSVFNVFKSLLAKSHLNDNPALSASALLEIERNIESTIHLDTPLSAIGLDSMTMTWIVVKLEEKYEIDASCVSFFELHDVNDLITQIVTLLPQNNSELVQC